jgi:hypothetical protein
MLMAISNVLLGIGLCMCGWHLWRIYRRIFLLEVAAGTPSASHNSVRNAIAQVREHARCTLGKPPTYTDFVAHLDWLEQQHP